VEVKEDKIGELELLMKLMKQTLSHENSELKEHIQEIEYQKINMQDRVKSLEKQRL
jgi:hydroxymethylglutaryl-CoA reductase